MTLDRYTCVHEPVFVFTNGVSMKIAASFINVLKVKLLTAEVITSNSSYLSEETLRFHKTSTPEN